MVLGMSNPVIPTVPAVACKAKAGFFIDISNNFIVVRNQNRKFISTVFSFNPKYLLVPFCAGVNILYCYDWVYF